MVIGAIVTITKSITNLELRIERNINTVIKEIRKEAFDENVRLRREIGETLKALKEHVVLYETKHAQLELYIRDNYIEVPTFKEALQDLKDNIKALFDKLSSYRRS